MNKYSCTVHWSEADEVYIAVCPELAGVSAFGDTPTEALAELDTVIELTVETYAEQGWPLPQPGVITGQEYSGQFRARLPRSMHQQLARRAEAEGVSQNTLVVSYVAAGLTGARIEDRLASALQPLHSSLVGLRGAVTSVLRGLEVEAANTVKYQDPTLRRLYQYAGEASATVGNA